MLLRAPVIFDRIFIFTIVVAILLVFVKLIRQHELVALLGFGISAPKQIVLLIPIVLGASLVSITFIDLAMAPAVRALQEWGIGEYKVKNITADNPLWLEDGNNIVRATERVTFDELGDMQIFERSENGEVESVIWAERAVYDEPNWKLNGVEILTIAGSDGEKRSALRDGEARMWETNQTPKSIARLAAEPRDISLCLFDHRWRYGDFCHIGRHSRRNGDFFPTRPLRAIWSLYACADRKPLTQYGGFGDFQCSCACRI